MKRKLRIPALAVLAIAVLLSFGLGAAAGTIYVPGGGPAGAYATITEALAAASPGDKIVVGSSYDSTAETFPILVQKDNITIEADGVVEVVGEESKAVFVVGAHRVYNPYTHEYDVVRVSGVTIQGFIITGEDVNEDGDFIDTGDILPDVGIVVKEADDVTLTSNTIVATLEGIRLLNATGCTVSGNTITKIGPYNVGGVEHYQGIGIFLEQADGNTLTSNTVTRCGLGLFVFESDSNTISASTFSNNEEGGIVLNDSNGNTLTDLTVENNGGWGVRFVFADTNVFKNSWVEGNEYGGVELVGSQLNTIDKNIVVSNGDLALGQDAPQIVVAPGDKALLTNAVFDGMQDPESDYAHPFFDFREEKELVEAKLSFLEFWLWDLDYELEVLVQKTATAWGMADQGVQTSSLVAQIDKIIFEKRAIEKGKIYGTLSDPTNKDDGTEPVEFTPGSKMDDPAYNFTLEGSTHKLRDDLDKYEGDNEIDHFGLDRNGANEEPWETEDDELCWSKLDLIEIIKLAIKYEIYNTFAGNDVDSLKEKIEDYADRGLILETDKDELIAKLDAILGYLAQINVIIDDGETTATDSIVDKLKLANDALTAARSDAADGTPYDIAKAKLLEAKGYFEEAITAKLEIYGIIGSIWHKLCLVNLELPPETRVNSKLVGKKEKPWAEITHAELYGYGDPHVNGLVDDVVDALNGDTLAIAILASVDPDRSTMEFTPADIVVDNRDLRHSIKNVISSNIITSDLDNILGENIGIVLASSFNTVVNNLITNEGVKPLDEETRYEEIHRLDVGILLLSNENLIAYNAIEFINTGMIRGGCWEWYDYQLEYIFEKLARVAYWPGPGEEIQGCGRPIPEEIESRDTDYVSVLIVRSESVSVSWTATVKRNRIALNFFEWCGVGIDIENAESNVIDENLFYECANAGIQFGTGSMPNIKLEENDYYGGHSVDNNGTLAVDASKDYTPPVGALGHAPTLGNVIDPAATAPFCYDNFGTIAKFTELKQWLSDRGITFNMEAFFSGGLPPKLTLFGRTVVLPPDKPRVCGDIFGALPPTGECCQFYEGWNLTSLPVEPVNPDPEVVYDEVAGTLYLYEYDPEMGTWNTVENGLLTEVSSMGAYYLWLAEDTLVCVTGTVLDSPQALQLGDAGWYTFGVPYEVDWDDGGQIMVTRGTTTYDLAQAVAARWIWNLVYEYDAVAQDWITTSVATGTTLQVCKGYWFYTYEDDLLFGIWETPQEGPPGPPPVPSTKSLNTLKAPGTPPMPGEPVSFSADGLEFTNYPNPVRDVHTTTFAVKGAMAVFVEAIKVQIFDLSGRLVYEEEMAGKSFDWHTENDYGELLANGVYLYKLYALVEGKWVVSDVRKLAILR